METFPRPSKTLTKVVFVRNLIASGLEIGGVRVCVRACVRSCVRAQGRDFFGGGFMEASGRCQVLAYIYILL